MTDHNPYVGKPSGGTLQSLQSAEYNSQMTMIRMTMIAPTTYFHMSGSIHVQDA